jgi:hypothetical protein
MPKRHDHLGTDHADLFLEEGQAAFRLLVQWDPVAGGPAFHDVADIDTGTGNSHPLLDDLGQELSGWPHEGPPRLILLTARPFSNQKDLRAGVPLSKDEVLPASPKRATVAFAHLPSDLHKAIFGRDLIERPSRLICPKSGALSPQGFEPHFLDI